MLRVHSHQTKVGTKSLSNSLSLGLNAALSSVHTELLPIAMQKWLENFAKEWVEYPFLAIPANVNGISNALESIHTELSDSDTKKGFLSDSDAH